MVRTPVLIVSSVMPGSFLQGLGSLIGLSFEKSGLACPPAKATPVVPMPTTRPSTATIDTNRLLPMRIPPVVPVGGGIILDRSG